MMSSEIPTWQRTIGRVAFLNCDPLYHELPEEWNVLAAPPAWLTGHLLRKDCLIAPIPAADWALNKDKLILVPELGIISDGAVGSVLLFGHREIGEMRDVALPTDSATSRRLLMYLLNKRGHDPRPVEMGPDLDTMLARCDGALLIGDRALHEAQINPDLVRMDLGMEWKDVTGLPMVFAVFAAPREAPLHMISKAHGDLMKALHRFQDKEIRENIINHSSQRSSFSSERIGRYFDEVLYSLDREAELGLTTFMSEVLEIEADLEFLVS
ncbi:MAG: menaquinone biosynthesis protein [Candidatus Thalassarchaeaceae archaeon]|jgi:chorismate dehydratase|nr:menaquinone biosynthesis protein [Candidatus Thalassarchaeaceae archaeon]